MELPVPPLELALLVNGEMTHYAPLWHPAPAARLWDLLLDMIADLDRQARAEMVRWRAAGSPE